MRAAIASAVLGLGLFAAPAQATPILIYKELARLSLSAFITDADGVTQVESREQEARLLLNPTVTNLRVSQKNKCTGGAAEIRESGSMIEAFLVTEMDGDCGPGQGVLDYGSSGMLVYDLTFRPTEQDSLRLNYYPVGGLVSMLLQDVRTGLVVYQMETIREFAGMFEFPNNHLYRLIATSRVQTKFGDPYGDFALNFTDKLTGDGLGFESAPPVPEPTSMLLLTTGLAGLALRRKQKRSKEM